MKTETIQARITFTEPVLGTLPGNKELMEEFIAVRADTEGKIKDELRALPAQEQVEKAMTVFPRNANGPFIWDYQIKGFIKGSVLALLELGDISISKWGYKKAVDLFVHVYPRQIQILGTDGNPIGQTKLETLQRPLRAETMQGDRVCLASSEVVPAGCSIVVDIHVLTGTNGKSKSAVLTLDDIRACLDYGKIVGYSQWRSASYGRFTWSEELTTE